MSDAFGHAAKRTQTVEAAAAEDEEIDIARGADECLHGVLLERLGRGSTEVDVRKVGVFACERGDDAYGAAEAGREMLGRDQRGFGIWRAVQTDCERARERAVLGRGSRNQHGARCCMEQLAGDTADQDLGHAAMSV